MSKRRPNFTSDEVEVLVAGVGYSSLFAYVLFIMLFVSKINFTHNRVLFIVTGHMLYLSMMQMLFRSFVYFNNRLFITV